MVQDDEIGPGYRATENGEEMSEEEEEEEEEKEMQKAIAWQRQHHARTDSKV